MEFFGSPCSLNNSPVEGFENEGTTSNAELLNMYIYLIIRITWHWRQPCMYII